MIEKFIICEKCANNEIRYVFHGCKACNGNGFYFKKFLTKEDKQKIAFLILYKLLEYALPIAFFVFIVLPLLRLI